MITCVIDACSYTYLQQTPLLLINGGEEKTLFEELESSNALRIKQSRVVESEITNSTNSNLPESLWKIKHRTHSFSRKKGKFCVYNDALFDGGVGATSKDAGEKANLAVCIDSFRHGNNQSIIFLTDDKKALSVPIIDEAFSAFPYFLKWTSFDVVLFLFYTKYRSGFTDSVAEDAIQNIVALLTKGARHPHKIKLDQGQIDNNEYSRECQAILARFQPLKQRYLKGIQTIKKTIELQDSLT